MDDHAKTAVSMTTVDTGSDGAVYVLIEEQSTGEGKTYRGAVQLAQTFQSHYWLGFVKRASTREVEQAKIVNFTNNNALYEIHQNAFLHHYVWFQVEAVFLAIESTIDDPERHFDEFWLWQYKIPNEQQRRG